MKHLTNGDQCKEGNALVKTYVFDTVCISPLLRQSLRVSRDCTHSVKVNCAVLSKGQYVYHRLLFLYRQYLKMGFENLLLLFYLYMLFMNLFYGQGFLGYDAMVFKG